MTNSNQKNWMFLALLSLTFSVFGCATARSPVTGFLYSDVQSSDAVTSNQAGNRVGEACSVSYLGAVATGDSSIETARRNGGITMISSVDHTANNYFLVYSKFCTIVRGR